MKRIGYLYEKFISIDNLILAVKNATHNKKRRRGIVKDAYENPEKYALKIQRILERGIIFSPPHEKIRRERNKIRCIKVPRFYPDQIVHWALMQVIDPVINRGMYRYCCGSVVGRGTKGARKAVQKFIKSDPRIKYVYKADVHHFFASVDTEILKQKFRRVIKDAKILKIIDGILDCGSNGLPIGFYTSQGFSNFYLQSFDHAVKEKLKIKHYVRYVDDIVMLDSNKRKLHKAHEAIVRILRRGRLTIKGNWQVWRYGTRHPGSTDHYIYSVISVDEETDDTVYSGFKYAMDNAAAGQTITVVGDATYKGNLVVPAQITVTVEDTIKLTVTGNVTVEADGKLVLGNTSQLIVGDEGKTSSVTVAGELDASEAGVINAAAGATAVNVYSTGTLTYVNAINSTNVKVNAAYYNEADEYVYTSVAKAVAYAMENDLPLPIHATGVFSEAGTIESAGVSIVIDPAAVVTLGNITLNDATISGTGDYSATISGLTGAGDAATTSTVSVTKTSATVSSTVTLNAEGVNEYALTINAIDGNTTVAAGTVEFVGDTIYAYKDNALSIATGATLLLGENESFSIWGTKYISNEGTILIEGDVTITDSTILPGQVTVADDGSLTVNATYQSIPVILAVTGNVTVEADGTFIVNGILMFGEPPELLGSTTSGTIDGKVTLNGTAYVFAGASVADTEFVSAQATEINTTAYSINGIDLVTAYTFGNEAIDNMYIDTIVYGLDDLDTWTVDSNDNSVRANIVWHSGETTIGSEYIGEYAEVSTEIAYNSVPITISVGSHISLSIDNVIVDNWTGSYYTLSIGTHTVSVVVDPGYSGNVTITFNGQTVQNGGTITVTSDMLTQMGDIVLSATGQLTQDSTVVIDGGNSGDSSMGLTDYLLIILVVLIVIMAIMVAMRLMRS